MSSKGARLGVMCLLLLLGAVTAGSALAGSAVIGAVAGSTNATLGGQALLPNTTIFSGDSLQVSDGVAVVAIGNSSRMVFGRETHASFLRDTTGVTVELGQGNVSLYHPDDGVALRVKVRDLSIVPAKGFKTLGEVAMIGGAIVITAKEGVLRLERNGSVKELAKGKTITLATKAAKAAAPAGGGGMSAATIWGIAGTAAAGVGAVEGAVAISRANDAKDAAANAASVASQAVTAANTATAAANAAQSAANLVGCALDKLNPTVSPSPYTPPAGSTCP